MTDFGVWFKYDPKFLRTIRGKAIQKSLSDGITRHYLAVSPRSWNISTSAFKLLRAQRAAELLQSHLPIIALTTYTHSLTAMAVSAV